jgi:hypothetical protein
MTKISKKVSEKYLGKGKLGTINDGYPYSPSLALIMTGKPISSALAIPSSTLPTQPRLFHQTSFTHLKINESLCLTNIMCLKRRQGFMTGHMKKSEQSPNDLSRWEVNRTLTASTSTSG